MRVVFLGTHFPRLDDKGRLFLPARFRDELAGGVVMTPGVDRCVSIYTTAGFEEVRARLRSGPFAAQKARAFGRMIFAGAHDEVPDRQGRVTIPPALRDYAGLDRDCAVVGADTRVEVWDAAAWQEWLGRQQAEFSEIPDDVLADMF